MADAFRKRTRGTGDGIARYRPAGALPVWNSITLLPNPVPELDQRHIDTRLHSLKMQARLPIMLEPDGSRSSARPIALRRLATAAERRGIFFSFGDLQPIFDEPSYYAEFQTIRGMVPQLPIFAELPVSRLLPQPDVMVVDPEQACNAIEDLGINGLIITLDGLQQTFSTTNNALATGALQKISELVNAASVPVIARSMSGIPRQIARLLVDRRVRSLIVGGSEKFEEWIRIQQANTEADDYAVRPSTFRQWGIPTIASIRMLRSMGVPIISDGQIETGLDAVKALCLGAEMVVLPLSGSRSGVDSETAIEQDLEFFENEFRAAMFLSGASNLLSLSQVPFIAVGETREWLEAAETLWKHDSSS